MVVRVGLVIKEDDPIQRETNRILSQKNIDYFVINDPGQICVEDFEQFSGYFLICLPGKELHKWEDKFKNELSRFFLIYYYHSFSSPEVSLDVFSYFDFIVVGDNRIANLFRLVNFLKGNYWRKIPPEWIKNVNGKFSPLLQNILFIMSISEEENITLDYLSEKLHISTKEILQEIQKTCGLNFSQFKKKIKDFFQQ